MPTKIVFNIETGEQEEVEMEGEELTAYEAQRTVPEPKMVTIDDMIAAAVAKALKDRGIS